MGRKLLMSSLMVYFYRGSPQQVALGLFVTVTYLIAFLKTDPYSSHHLETLQGLSLTTQSVTLFCTPPPTPPLYAVQRCRAPSRAQAARAWLVCCRCVAMSVSCILGVRVTRPCLVVTVRVCRWAFARSPEVRARPPDSAPNAVTHHAQQPRCRCPRWHGRAVRADGRSLTTLHANWHRLFQTLTVAGWMRSLQDLDIWGREELLVRYTVLVLNAAMFLTPLLLLLPERIPWHRLWHKCTDPEQSR